MEYQITLYEKQLRLLMYAAEITSRVMIGQVDKLEEILTSALERHKYKDMHFSELWVLDEYQQDKEWIVETLREIHCKCWQQAPNQSYGVHYSKESDTLIDFVEVARHELWKNIEGEKFNSTNDAYPATHWNKDEPLVEIKKLEDAENI